MAAPIVSGVSPANGLSLGETFVTITGTGFNDELSGGSVRVFFGTLEAKEAGLVNATTILALTPPGALGSVDVVVQNITPQPDPTPPLVEPGSLVAGFEYRRPSIETRIDRTTDDAILIVTRTLVSELRRTVLENTHHDMHPEYVDATSATEEQEVQATAPSLKVIGPDVQEDRFYALNGRFAIETLAGSPGGAQYSVFAQPVTVSLRFDYAGLARTKGEAMNLWGALTLFIDRTPYLAVPQDGLDPANGTLQFELNPVWDQRGVFSSKTTRDGFVQFTGAMMLRGVHTVSRQAAESRSADTLLPEVENFDP